ncbi:hypothetical protein DV733_00175 [Halapricum salinum]|uniref:Uncharacterized protein n=1 Tax=Halapricum salinum TaxID=1457250 RepID=A0A4D6H7Z3_9EURY|nr:hypothetical protein DV733_00175 [Halapricum salinum]
MLALGAPRETTEFRVPVPCPDCSHPKTKPELREVTEVLVRPDCESASVAVCSECGQASLGTTVVECSIVSKCRDCGSVSEL